MRTEKYDHNYPKRLSGFFIYLLDGACRRNAQTALCHHADHRKIRLGSWFRYRSVNFHSNRTLLIITHFKKFGTLLTINRDSSINGASVDDVPLNTNSDVFTIKTHFGSDNNDVHVAARYIAQRIDIEKPLFLSIALKDYNIETLKAIVTAINQIKPW
ncbi:proteasome assembly chaperone 3-like [Harpegnathos saltator]|uniref:proteasome assembly chaperone 3-like n=1 Tax=Harpegnathos saltator TaxID=610380 RepID=UPI00058D762A|nr:proteasome assembly chaperone 3-like [Harpegnathos saltator]